MSAPSSTGGAKNLELKAAALERSIAGKTSQNAALDAAISSAEFYMQALRLTHSPAEKRRLDKKCKELLARAESIKATQDEHLSVTRVHPGDMESPKSTRKLSTRENIILLEGSKLNGSIFKPWTQPPTKAEFEIKEGQEPYLELPHLALSPSQQQSFAGWKRPGEALGTIDLKRNGTMLANRPVMILGSILYPYDQNEDHVILSPNGKYVLRLYFNGCWRRIEIDDMLPTSNKPRVLHVIDRACPGLLWPALIEKAYLKVRGGYDFPGSNSGTDLAVLTGWLPQQVFLHDTDIDHNDLWEELYQAFVMGNMLLTIGTGKLPRREQKQLGLAAEHDYAVLELKMTSGVKEILIKNPWSDGDVWIGATRRRPNPSHDAEVRSGKDVQASADNQGDPEMMPGTFWMDFNSVFHYFENMYISWKPGLFSHRQDLHFSWNVQNDHFAPHVFADNPQFSVSAAASGHLWLLLNRHFRTGDYTQANSGRNGYISLYLFEKNGAKVISSEGAIIRGPFVDSPNTLLRFDVAANTAYTAVVVTQDLPSGKHNFTLSALTNSQIVLDDAISRYRFRSSAQAAWSRDTAGGNSDSVRYLSNPQFNFAVHADDTNVALVLRVVSDLAGHPDKTTVRVKLLVLSNPSHRRITRLPVRDIVISSGDYRRGSAVVETRLSKGNYAVICSTFDENQLAKFQLDLHLSSPGMSEQATVLVPIPSESSGRLSIVLPPAVFSAGCSKFVAQVTVPRLTRVIVLARTLKQQQGQSSSNSLYRLSLQQGQGPYAKIIATSADNTGEFLDAARGLRIEDRDLQPWLCNRDSGGLWLVLERPVVQASAHGIMNVSIQPLEVEILAEERVLVDVWKVVDA